MQRSYLFIAVCKNVQTNLMDLPYQKSKRKVEVIKDHEIDEWFKIIF
jgi:hypothetical protein